ncbi:MAG TPA: hypothetical protein VG271_15710, partial [Beijerinckiaceae bacterium]|nr:hypothetical protein [Beijerinckiaceae bacterium]
AQSEKQQIVTVQSKEFCAYLAQHGSANLSAVPFYRAAAKTALREIVSKTPRLTMWGMGVGRPERKADGKWEDVREFSARFSASRKDLLSDGGIDAFLASLAFLTKVTPTKTVRNGTGSYWLKHIAENYSCTYPEGEKLGPRYIPNGAFIAAAIQAGFKFKLFVDELGYTNVNVTFNMSKPLLVDLDCQIRPNGAHAQSRRARQEMRRNPALFQGWEWRFQ